MATVGVPLGRNCVGTSHGGASVAISTQSWLVHWSGARSSKVAVKAIRPPAAREPDTWTPNGNGSARGGGGMIGSTAPSSA